MITFDLNKILNVYTKFFKLFI